MKTERPRTMRTHPCTQDDVRYKHLSQGRTDSRSQVSECCHTTRPLIISMKRVSFAGQWLSRAGIVLAPIENGEGHLPLCSLITSFPRLEEGRLEEWNLLSLSLFFDSWYIPAFIGQRACQDAMQSLFFHLPLLLNWKRVFRTAA